MFFRKIFKIILLLFVFVVIVFSHHFHEHNYIAEIETRRLMSVENLGLIKIFDLGLHSALASFLWVDTRTHLPYLREGFPAFWYDLNRVIALDEKFPTPYVHTLLLLPDSEFEDKIEVAVSIGKYGVENASPDWRIPFYLGSILHLYDGDKVLAAKYFDIAAERPGIHKAVRSYAINYGLLRTVREQSLGLWEAIYESADDKSTRERAILHIEHLKAAEIVEMAVAEYYEAYGKYPEHIQDLLEEGFLIDLPKSPFGVIWKMYPEGLVGVEH